MTITLSQIIPVIGAQWQGETDAIEISHVSIDSRSLQNSTGTLFFALSGPNNDAHNYIGELLDSGVFNFVVSRIPDEVKGQANFLVVPDVLSALQQLAGWYRQLFHFPVIGITGSNGKTIVKEWLNFLLGPDYNIIRSPKSYNSQVGVPLSVFGINEMHNLGIFEAGISTVAEMDRLEEIIRPEIGILSNIGTAHDEGFSSIGEKIREKTRLFKRSDVLIYQKNKTLETFIPESVKRLSWSFKDDEADLVFNRRTSDEKTIISLKSDTSQEIEIPFRDEASVENAMHCVVLLMHFGYEVSVIKSRIGLLYPVEMRLVVKNGIQNSTVIDDSYSSDFQSLKIALDFLENQKQHKKKTLILSDIFQSGLTNEELYSRVSQLVISNKINRVIGIGPVISSFRNKFLNCSTFETTSEFLAAFPEMQFGNETILIKGARQFRFEKIVALLEEKTHETVLEINLNAISHNLNFFKSKLRPETKMMVMVKAFGYGNGGLEIARLLEHHKVDYLGVAFADEGIALKASGISLPIMVMNPESTSFSAIIQHGLEPEIYSLKGLEAFLKTVSAEGKNYYPIHIKIDTGMHRLGFEEGQMDELIAILKDNPLVSVQSVLSHMATSDDLEHHEFALRQIALFDRLSSRLTSELDITPIRHILNTSGISNYPMAQFDMVRLGIGLYGISNDASEQKYLENVSTLKSIISQLRTIPAGDSVGYGRRFVAARETRIATIPIGYADGISRHWGNGIGYISVNGKQAPVTGSVCMDMLMVDVSGISCKEGDPVVIFGKDPTVIEMASRLKTIPYEILTSISQRVKRVFYRE